MDGTLHYVWNESEDRFGLMKCGGGRGGVNRALPGGWGSTCPILRFFANFIQPLVAKIVNCSSARGILRLFLLVTEICKMDCIFGTKIKTF